MLVLPCAEPAAPVSVLVILHSTSVFWQTVHTAMDREEDTPSLHELEVVVASGKQAYYSASPDSL